MPGAPSVVPSEAEESQRPAAVVALYAVRSLQNDMPGAPSVVPSEAEESPRSAAVAALYAVRSLQNSISMTRASMHLPRRFLGFARNDRWGVTRLASCVTIKREGFAMVSRSGEGIQSLKQPRHSLSRGSSDDNVANRR